MQAVISSAQMREIDRLTTERHGIPSLVLRENADEATARVTAARLSGDVADKSILVLCGRGNNGGDGAATARLLAVAGANVELVLFGRVNDTRGDARTNFDAALSLAGSSNAAEASTTAGTIKFFECESETSWSRLLSGRLNETRDVIVDAMFGTGLTRPVEDLHLEVVKYLRRVRESRRSHARALPLIVSIDIPSGLNSDSPDPIGEAVQADVTVTMTAPKPANVLPPAAFCNSAVFVADIGSPVELIEAAKSQLLLVE